MKLKDLFDFINANEEDIDVYVDGIDGIAVCAPVSLTEEGKKHFADALELEVKNYTVMGDDKDYDDLENEEGKLVLAWDLLTGLAGYCSYNDYNKWFEE